MNMETPDQFLERYRKHKEIDHSHRKRGKYLREIVYGANDGIVSTFSVVSGAAGASLGAGVILILGIASLIADGFSMASSNYLSLTSERKLHRLHREKERREVERKPNMEKEEVREILRQWGIPEEYVEPSTEAITKDKKRWVDLMMREELNIIEENDEKPCINSMVIFGSFVIMGSLPLLPYLFFVPTHLQFPVSVISTLVVLFIVGAARSYFLKKQWWWKLGLEMLLIGGVALGIAYGIGYAVKAVVGAIV